MKNSRGFLHRLFAGIVAAATISALHGCMNVYTRFPTTEAKIEECYQCSRESAMMSAIVMFPQIMSDAGGRDSFMAENIVTIPLGCLVLCDAACETVLDTAFLPFDWPISCYRRKTKNHEENRR